MGRLKLILILITNLLLTFSCDISDSDKPLKGKIIVEPAQDSNCYIYGIQEYRNDSFKSFKYRNDGELSYGFFRWLNTKDSFVGYEEVERHSNFFGHSNIALFDLSGKLVDYIYKAGNGEEAIPLYPSRDDKYFLFTTQLKEDKIPVLSLLIMNLEKREIVQRIDNIGREFDFNVHESPWLHGGYRFVYSIGELREADTISPGVYAYDIISRERKMLIPGGHNAIVSPTSNEIAFEKDNSIKVFNLKTNEEKTLHNFCSSESLFNMHWTPDGEDTVRTFFDDLKELEGFLPGYEN